MPPAARLTGEAGLAAAAAARNRGGCRGLVGALRPWYCWPLALAARCRSGLLRPRPCHLRLALLSKRPCGIARVALGGAAVTAEGWCTVQGTSGCRATVLLATRLTPRASCTTHARPLPFVPLCSSTGSGTSFKRGPNAAHHGAPHARGSRDWDGRRCDAWCCSATTPGKKATTSRRTPSFSSFFAHPLLSG